MSIAFKLANDKRECPMTSQGPEYNDFKIKAWGVERPL
jgi:hypothetical protein